MTKVLVLYHSSYGHIETLAQAVAEGVALVQGATATVKRVPELMDADTMRDGGMKVDQYAPVAGVDEPPDYDAIIFGTPTRFGNMSAQMRKFLEQTGGLWFEGKLIGKVGSVFTSTATGAGSETTITSFHNTLLHHGFIIAGVPYSTSELLDISEVRAGSPYGAATLAGTDGSRRPTGKELAIARAQGQNIAKVAKSLVS